MLIVHIAHPYQQILNIFVILSRSIFIYLEINIKFRIQCNIIMCVKTVMLTILCIRREIHLPIINIPNVYKYINFSKQNYT